MKGFRNTYTCIHSPQIPLPSRLPQNIQQRALCYSVGFYWLSLLNIGVCTWPWASLMAQTLKNLPAMQETQVWFLGWGDPLEKGMANHSIILPWRIPWTEDPGGYSPWGCKESDMTEWLTHTHTRTSIPNCLTIPPPPFLPSNHKLIL